MALHSLRFTHFSGILQDRPQSELPLHAAAQAWNIDTQNGRLKTAGGYFTAAPDVGGNVPLRLFRWQRADGSATWLAAMSAGIRVYEELSDSWKPAHIFPRTLSLPSQLSFLRLRMGAGERLLIANPFGQMQLWDGQALSLTPFGNSQQLSDMPQRFCVMYFGRLFCAGDPLHPSRLYWSQVPGGSRSVEDWRGDEASPDTGGGHTEIGGDAEPITGLFALSNQLVIIKNEKLYRLVGDRPSNYRIIAADRGLPLMTHCACVPFGDRLFFLSQNGLYCYDGQGIVRPLNASAITPTLAACNFDGCVSAAAGDKLWFTVRRAGASVNNVAFVYDTRRGTWMERRGFNCADLFACDGRLYMLTGEGRVVCFDDDAPTYAGERIYACWQTPKTDAGGKFTQKQLLSVYCRVSGDGLCVTSDADGESGSAQIFPDFPDEAVNAELTLTGNGRSISLVFTNPGGGGFCVEDGAELLYDSQRRPL